MRINILILWLIGVCFLSSCSASKNYSGLQKEFDAYIVGKDARIGVAAIFEGKDSVQVNGNRDFPMLSVYKFPEAIAVADYCRNHGLDLDGMVSISADEIKPDTWSPMREKYGINDLRLSLREVLTYSLAQSDNNACDKARLFDAFYRQGLYHENQIMKEIGKIIIDCQTGTNRFPFIADSAYDMEATEKMIADLSEIVFKY